jgi:hypothetical protein
VDRERTARQENGCKRMRDHGALETNDGRKKLVGPDRQQQRTREDLEASLATAQQRVDNKVEALQAQPTTGAESKAKGHGTRLEQRQPGRLRVAQAREEAQHQPAKQGEPREAFGPPKARADRDVRPQTIMTYRPLLLANALMAFRAVRWGNLHTKVRVAWVFHWRFARRGAALETASELVSWVNTTGVSLPSRRLLEEVVDGLSAMDLRAQGQPMRVGLKDMPPCTRSMHGQSEGLFYQRLSEVSGTENL